MVEEFYDDEWWEDEEWVQAAIWPDYELSTKGRMRRTKGNHAGHIMKLFYHPVSGRVWYDIRTNKKPSGNHYATRRTEARGLFRKTFGKSREMPPFSVEYAIALQEKNAKDNLIVDAERKSKGRRQKLYGYRDNVNPYHNLTLKFPDKYKMFGNTKIHLSHVWCDPFSEVFGWVYDYETSRKKVKRGRKNK